MRARLTLTDTPRSSDRDTERATSTSAAKGARPFRDERPASARLAQLAAMAAERSTSGNRLPPALHASVEHLANTSIGDVTVVPNSSRPNAVNAHAYAQGNAIHLAPGKEHHLAHEAWHLAQQAQGRVAATEHVNGMPVNSDTSLEREASVKGSEAEALAARIEQE